MFRIAEVPLQLRPALFTLAAATLIFLSSHSSQAQRVRDASGSREDEPAFNEFKGVRLGMTADEARKKLGDPKDKSDGQDFYMFGENTAAQILYKTNKVVTISIDFMDAVKDAPSPKQVFGTDIEAKPDGSINKRVSYPKAGYWVSYSRTAGDSPTISITIQVIEK
jgi:hypothetical protein